MIPIPPPIWRYMTAVWGFSAHELRASWAAIYQAHGPVASSWRMVIMQLDGQDILYLPTLEAWIATHVQPPRIMQLFDALAEEGLLSRHGATRLQEKVLGKLDATGNWREQTVPQETSTIRNAYDG